MRMFANARVSLIWRPHVWRLGQPGWHLTHNSPGYREHTLLPADSTLQIQWRPYGLNPGLHLILALRGCGVHLWWGLRVSPRR